MPVMLEVAIGLVFVYLLVSLLCSAIAEAVEHYVRARAGYLKQGVEKLLLADANLCRDLYDHPLIKSLYTKASGTMGRAVGPAYIPSRQFVLALMDLITNRPGAPQDPAATPAARLRAAVDGTALPPQLKRALLTLIDDAGGDMDKVKGNIQAWFDGAMDRVAGWYKRRAQLVLFVVGSFATIAVNADTLWIVDTLSHDSTVRTAVVNAADAYVREHPQRPAVEGAKPAGAGDAAPPAGSPEAELQQQVTESVNAVREQLGTLGLPVGWRWMDERRGGLDPAYARLTSDADKLRYRVENRILPASRQELRADLWPQLMAHLLGWLLTAFAVSFGAPFWFDMLNKIMVIRSTVKPREKSREEGSEDRPQPPGPQTLKLEVATPRA